MNGPIPYTPETELGREERATSAVLTLGDIERSMAELRRVVTQHFPNLWLAVDAGLAACATLLLEDVANCTALMYVGGPATGKTTVAEMFDGARVDGTVLTKLSDKFTPASFVGHAANRTPAELERIDLLPRIRHKVLITPELAPVFRGREDDLTEKFSTITRIMDGEGYISDSATHGERGVRGDYYFVWLGCTTPFPDRTWEIMAQLGSRLFFLFLNTAAGSTEEELMKDLGEAVPYINRRTICKQGVHSHIAKVFHRYGGVRGVQWDHAATPEPVRHWIVRLATLLAAVREESPHRAKATLYNLARGHALMHGRTALTLDDIPLLADVAVSSMPWELSQTLRSLILAESNVVRVADVVKAAGLSDKPVKVRMEQLQALGICQLSEEGRGKPMELGFHPNFKWCEAPILREFLHSRSSSEKLGGERDARSN